MSPGTMLGGRYRLDDLLTEHDGARFWRATDTILARSVAVHALSSADGRAGAVLDAARESVSVTDPHFLRVLDCNDDGTLTWVINEWGEGMSLDRLLEQRGPLPVPRAAWLVREVAEAIANAHDRGLTHGRLNPESVLITDAGSVKVIGFVTMSAFEGSQPSDPVFGELDPRERDVVDLAGLLYAALTGRWPGASRSTVPRAPRDGRAPLRPRQVRAGIPRPLDALCERVLNKEGTHHQLPVETAQEIAAALADVVGNPTGLVGPVHGPLDPAGLHAEPTQQLRLPRTGDPEATVAAPAPVPTPEPEPDRKVDTASIPAFEQPDDRPLFASSPRRVPAGAPLPPPPRPANTGSFSGSMGGHTGSGTFWPFEPEEEPSGFTGREGRGWLRTAAVIAVVIALLAALFFAFNYVRGSLGSEQSGTSGGTVGKPVKIISAKDFDPEGDGEENPAQAPLAIDGKAGTGWSTVHYLRSPKLGNLKSGVGLMLDLGSDHGVKSVSLRFGGRPTTFSVYAAPPGTPSTPGDLGGLQQVAGPVTATGTSYVVRPKHTVRTRFVLVWLTSLPQVGTGDYQGSIDDVQVFG